MYWYTYAKMGRTLTIYFLKWQLKKWKIQTCKNVKNSNFSIFRGNKGFP